MTTVNICSTVYDASERYGFYDWKDGLTSFTDGTCSPACPQPVSQQSSPPPSQESSPPVVEGEGDGENEAENVPEPEPAVPAGEGDTGSGGCALISGEDGSPSGAGLSLLLAVSALLAVPLGNRQRREKAR